LNIQPVIPVKLSENWNLITRIIQPIVWQQEKMMLENRLKQLEQEQPPKK
jgi:hypothetical protein